MFDIFCVICGAPQKLYTEKIDENKTEWLSRLALLLSNGDVLFEYEDFGSDGTYKLKDGDYDYYIEQKQIYKNTKYIYIDLSIYDLSCVYLHMDCWNYGAVAKLFLYVNYL